MRAKGGVGGGCLDLLIVHYFAYSNLFVGGVVVLIGCRVSASGGRAEVLASLGLRKGHPILRICKLRIVDSKVLGHSLWT